MVSQVQEEPGPELFAEKKRIERLGRIRQFVFGSLDGLLGTIKGKLASLNLFRGIVEIVIVGAVSAGGGYLLGSVIPHVLGFSG